LAVDKFKLHINFLHYIPILAIYNFYFFLVMGLFRIDEDIMKKKKNSLHINKLSSHFHLYGVSNFKISVNELVFV